MSRLLPFSILFSFHTQNEECPSKSSTNERYACNVLSFPSFNKTKSIKSDGHVINFTPSTIGSTRSHLRTSEPIPHCIRSFCCEFIMNNCGTTNDISVGLYSNVESLTYHGINGKILDGKDYVTHTESFMENDVIGCDISRIIVDEVTYNLCHFTKNGRKVGLDRVIEGKTLWPGIYINSPEAQLTYLDYAPLKYCLGKVVEAWNE